MSDLDRTRRRRAEEAACQDLDGSSSSEEDRLETASTLEEEERALYLRHLFVHGLLESLTEVDTEEVREAGEARVLRVVDTIRGQESPAGASRRWFRYAAVAMLIGALVVAGILVLSNGGIEVEAAIDHALHQASKELDRKYEGEIVFDYKDGTRDEFGLEFISGPGRFYAEGFLPMGPGGLMIPFEAGCSGKEMWLQLPFVLLVRDLTEKEEPGRMSKWRRWDQRLSDFMGDVSTILTHMRKNCDLKMQRLESGLLLVEARPRKEQRHHALKADLFKMTLNEETYEVKSISLHKIWSSGEETPEFSMLMKPMKKAAIAVRHVKNFVAPAETFLPPSLDKKDGEKDQDKKDQE